MNERDTRLLKIRSRLLTQIAIGVVCEAILWATLWKIQVPDIVPNWLRIGGAIAIFNLLPLLIVHWVNWRQARTAVSDMWAFGEHNFEEVSRTLAAYMAVVALAGLALPALVPMAAVLIGMNIRRFRYERSELFALLYAGLIVAGVLIALALRARA